MSSPTVSSATMADGAGDILVVLCTVPTPEVADRLAKDVVSAGLAACVNLVPGVRSIYRWKGELCDDAELLLVIKTTRSRLEALAARIAEGHPYETPELLALPVSAGSLAYLEWVRSVTR